MINHASEVRIMPTDTPMKASKFQIQCAIYPFFHRESFVSFVNNLGSLLIGPTRKLRAIHLHLLSMRISLRVAEVIKVITGVFLTDPWLLNLQHLFFGGDVEV